MQVLEIRGRSNSHCRRVHALPQPNSFGSSLRSLAAMQSVSHIPKQGWETKTCDPEGHSRTVWLPLALLGE